jgi:anti-sigma factor RsiW
MRCKKVSEHLERFLDGAVSSRRTIEIKKHLEACSSCSTAYTEIDATQSLFRKSTPPPIPEAIATNIMAAARDSFLSKQSDETGDISFLWWKESTLQARMAFVGILVMVLTAGIFMGKELSVKPDPLTVVEFPELDAFSAAQEGSLSYVYLNLTMPPR